MDEVWEVGARMSWTRWRRHCLPRREDRASDTLSCTQNERDRPNATKEYGFCNMLAHITVYV